MAEKKEAANKPAGEHKQGVLGWADPPGQAPRGRNAWRQDVAEQLKQKPGQWALVEQNAATRSGTSDWKKWDCEAASRQLADGSISIWARYIGPNGEHANK